MHGRGSTLDAHNSAEHPPLYEAVVAELYNDNALVVLWTDALPELHRDFTSRIHLKFKDMPGGKLSTEDVKRRIADARAQVIVVSTIEMSSTNQQST
jgi:hypothetical protein